MPDTIPYHTNKSSIETGSMLSSQQNKGGQFYYVRHGSTHLNSANKLRAWQDIPLDEDGKKEANKVGEQLKNKKIDVIVTSDLSRAEETARIISKHIGVKVSEKLLGLRPWNLGALAGQDVKDTLPILEEFARNEPDSAIKEGESFNTFKRRYITTVKKLMTKYAGKNVVMVSHHRGDRILDAWEAKGDNPNMEVDLNIFLKKGMEPGTYRIIKFEGLQKNEK
jgi:broad specificity phosphatase PhoE